MWRRYDETCRRRPDFQTTRFILGTKEAQLQWLHSVGVSSDAELARFVPSVPPPGLRGIVADPSAELFLWTGLCDVVELVGHFQRHSDRRGRVRVLDFGCGCGRLLRFLHQIADEWDISGADVNDESVTWCRENLASLRVYRNSFTPGLPKELRDLDLIISLSVFTHLPETSARGWLSELSRALRPGGILLLTTHGARALETIRDSAAHQTMFDMTPDEASRLLVHLPSVGIHHRPYPASVIAAANAGDDYGNTFVHSRYVDTVCDDIGLQLCESISGGLRAWQDIHVLKRTTS